MRGVRALLAAGAGAAAALNVTIAAGTVVQALQRGSLLGCHTDPGFMHQPQGILSQMIVGEAFETIRALRPGWANYSSGTAAGSAVLDASVRFAAAARPAMRVAFTGGTGAVGIAHRGLGNEGLVFAGGRPYEGVLFARATAAATLTITARDHVSGAALATTSVAVAGGGAWQSLPYAFTPSASTTCADAAPGGDVDCDAGKFGDYACVRCGGEVVYALTQPGAVVWVGYVSLQPGPWGRFAGLPVRADHAAVLAAMGVGLVRWGGSVNRNVDWAEWRGPPWNRSSLGTTWAGDGPSWGGAADYSSWGPFDALDAYTAMGINVSVTISDAGSPAHLGDLVEYCFGGPSTPFGALRVADGHAGVYRPSVFEIGNEQYNNNFVAQVAAMEARAAALGHAGELYYMFPQNGGLNAADQAKAKAAGLPIDRIVNDIHVGASGGIEAAAADFAASPSFGAGAFNGEVNAEHSAADRMLTEAADLNDWMNADPAILARIVGRTSSFCSERNGHWDGSPWHQGLSFFLPNQTWLGPAGQVHALLTSTWAPGALKVSPAAGGGVTVSAQRDTAANTLAVRITNSNAAATAVGLAITGMATRPAATTWTLAAQSPSQTNAPGAPLAIAPVQSATALPSGGGTVTVPPYSYTVLLLTGA